MTDTTRARDVLLGLACGDALGHPIEFTSPEQITHQFGTVTDMLDNGSHGKPAGTVTDDTEMTMCIARSLVETETFDGQDIADRFLEWYHSGPFDIGLMTADALQEYDTGTSWRDAGREVWQRRPEGQNAGNGSLMRCAPHAIAFGDDLDTLSQVSRASSAITHYDPRCTWACAILNCTIAGYLRGQENPFPRALNRVDGKAPEELVETLKLVPDQVEQDQLQNTGYVVHTLQTALYETVTADSLEEAIIAAVNRGCDADTIGAVTGALAGARFGADHLPHRWLDELQYRDDLELLAQALANV